MASLRKSTTPANDASTAKFLYTILKQLDHKSIDWTEVASELDITNGHAARMRFSRFKQHMEGVAPSTRKPRTEGQTQRKAKLDKKRKQTSKGKAKQQGEPELKGGELGLTGTGGSLELETMPEMANIKAEPTLKAEASDDDMNDEPHTSLTANQDTSGGGLGTDGYGDMMYDYDVAMESGDMDGFAQGGQHIKNEPKVKVEEDMY